MISHHALLTEMFIKIDDIYLPYIALYRNAAIG